MGYRFDRKAAVSTSPLQGEERNCALLAKAWYPARPAGRHAKAQNGSIERREDSFGASHPCAGSNFQLYPPVPEMLPPG
jgi:hypothetical protein